MWICKATQYWMVLMLAGLIAVGCTPHTATGGSNEATQAQNPSVPEYPPLYNVDVEGCGNIIASLKDGKRCITTQLQLWGPIGEAKLVQTGLLYHLYRLCSIKWQSPPKAATRFALNQHKSNSTGLIRSFK